MVIKYNTTQNFKATYNAELVYLCRKKIMKKI